ncbi:unnamed protein product, partial [Amoebophrya sp. A25]
GEFVAATPESLLSDMGLCAAKARNQIPGFLKKEVTESTTNALIQDDPAANLNDGASAIDLNSLKKDQKKQQLKMKRMGKKSQLLPGADKEQ